MIDLPAGVTLSDIDGPPMPRCEKCCQEFNPERDEKLCDECQTPQPDNEDAQEILAMIRDGHWPVAAALTTPGRPA